MSALCKSCGGEARVNTRGQKVRRRVYVVQVTVCFSECAVCSGPRGRPLRWQTAAQMNENERRIAEAFLLTYGHVPTSGWSPPRERGPA